MQISNYRFKIKELVEGLNGGKIRLVILSSNIYTRNLNWGKIFLTIMSAVAEMERNLVKEKQRNGIQLK